MESMHFAGLRHQMLEEIVTHAQLTSRVTGRLRLSDRVLEVMDRVPRHEFVPVELRSLAYVNSPLPIGFDKTISQPFINALMTDLLEVAPTDSVLEIGTGLGYQTAILAELAGKVYTIELIEELADEARKRLGVLDYHNIEIRVGDGTQGWPQHAPFDKIMVTAAPDLVPSALLNQLKPRGRMVIPAGLQEAQMLLLVTKSAEGQIDMKDILPVRFSALDTQST